MPRDSSSPHRPTAHSSAVLEERGQSRRRASGPGVLGLLFFALAAVWAMLMPIAGSPDENDHLIRAAAVVRGQAAGPQEEVASYPGKGPRTIVTVPAAYAALDGIADCFRKHPEIPSTCMPPVAAELGPDVDGLTAAGQYNPTYYALVGLPTLLPSPEAGMRGARLVSAALCAALLAWAVRALDRVRGGGTVGDAAAVRAAAVRAGDGGVGDDAAAGIAAEHAGHDGPSRALHWGLAVALTPMVFLLAGAVNPNGLEIAAAVSLTAALVGLAGAPVRGLSANGGPVANAPGAPATPTPRRPRIEGAGALLVQATVSAAIVCAMRPVSPLWAALIVVLGFVAVGAGRMRLLLRERAMIVVALGALATVGWTLGWTFTHGPLVGAPGGNAQYAGLRSGTLFLLGALDDQLVEAIGDFGWRDTPAPPLVIGAWLAGAVLLGVLVVLSRVRGRVLAATLAAALSVALVPVVIGLASLSAAGYVWQGRYSLPLIALTCLLAGLGVARATGGPDGELVRSVGRRLTAPLVVLLTLGHAVSLYWAARRHEIGLTPWPQPPDPTAHLPLGSLAWVVAGAAIALAMLAALVGMPRRRTAAERTGGTRAGVPPNAS